MQQLVHAESMLVQVPVTGFRLAFGTDLGLDSAHESLRSLIQRAEVTGLIQVHGNAPDGAVQIGIGVGSRRGMKQSSCAGRLPQFY
jgi:hypothetical protein